MSHLQIIGKQTVAGYEFTGIEGGFGAGKKAMLVKEIAEIHQKKRGKSMSELMKIENVLQMVCK